MQFENVHFDAAAQVRMAEGGASLYPLIEKYDAQMRGPCVEFGPYLNPILAPTRFPAAEITFVDGDGTALRVLQDRFAVALPPVRFVQFDLSGPTAQLLERLPKRFNAVVVSQVLNYLDFHRFLTTLHHVSNTNAYLFINNVIDFGIPERFSSNRPRDDREILATLPRFGWEIVEYQLVPSTSDRHQSPRLLLVAKRIARG
ncbi:MAG: hypothetical protein AB7P04_13275 [Bacteriovoracia bacterium]